MTRGMRTTWKPHEKHGRLTMQSDLPDGVFAFPKQRKEPLTDAKHVRNAVARFDQVTDVSETDRALALGDHPQPPRKRSARKAAVTRKKRARSR
jgi:hypothetical protein